MIPVLSVKSATQKLPSVSSIAEIPFRLLSLDADHVQSPLSSPEIEIEQHRLAKVNIVVEQATCKLKKAAEEESKTGIHINGLHKYY